MAGPPPPATDEKKLTTRLVVSHLLQVTVMIGVLGGVLFASAGRLDWWEAWAFLIPYYLIALSTALWMLRTNPALVQERNRPGPNAKAWDNALVGVNLVLTLGLFVVTGLDAGRFRWSEAPAIVRALGLLGLIPAFVLPLWASRVNAFLSSRVRIQQDRGHHVISEGPYRWVRHPMYLGTVFFNFSLPLLLGSWWGLLPGAAMNVIVILRTRMEDKTLQNELPGYGKYSRQVRYRLFPGIW